MALTLFFASSSTACTCMKFFTLDSLQQLEEYDFIAHEWFYISGQTEDVHYYQSGKRCNVSRYYYDSTINQIEKAEMISLFYKTEDSLNFVYKRIQVQYETIYHSNGQPLISRKYNRIGILESEEIYDHDRNFITSIYYHNNGLISSISYYLNYENSGHYQEYDEKGLPTRGRDYNKNETKP